METGNVLLDGFAARVRLTPQAAAVLECGASSSISYARLDDLANSAAQHLSDMGVGCNDHVVVTLPLGVEFLAYSLGAFKLGGVPALVDPRVEESALRRCLCELAAPVWISDTPHDSAPPTRVCPPRPRRASDPPVSVAREQSDPVLMLYTSGTTGAPKGVPWTSRELGSQIEVYREPGVDTEFCLFPHLALVAIAMGRTAVLPALATTAPAFVDVGALHRQLVDHGADYAFASPLLWQRLADYLELGHEAPPLRKAATAGSAVNPTLLQRLTRLMPGTAFSVPYASTEILMPITQISASDYVYHCGLGTWAGRGVPLGWPEGEMVVGIVDPEMTSADFDSVHLLAAEQIGEIVVTGPRVTRHYFRRPDVESHAKLRDPLDGAVWHRTADIGYVDDRGMLWYLCRKKDVVHRRGRPLYPDAIEAMLNMVTGAPLSAVVCHGEDVCYVLAEADAPPSMDTGAMAILCGRLELPPPRVVLLPGALPVDARHNSKIDRDATRAQMLALGMLDAPSAR